MRKPRLVTDQGSLSLALGLFQHRPLSIFPSFCQFLSPPQPSFLRRFLSLRRAPGPLSLAPCIYVSVPIVLELVEPPCICECTPDNRIDKHRYYYTANSASDRALTMTPLESQGYCYLRRSILTLSLSLARARVILIMYDQFTITRGSMKNSYAEAYASYSTGFPFLTLSLSFCLCLSTTIKIYY